MDGKASETRKNDPTLRAIREARRGRTWSRRTLGVLGIVAALAVVGGFATAQLLTPVTVNSSQAVYTGQGQTDPNFPTPSLTPNFVTGGPTPCTTGTQAYPASSASNYVLQVYLGVNNTCTASAFAEEWTWTSPATLTGETATVTITTDYGGAYTYSTSITLTVTAGNPGGTAKLEVILEYGATVPVQGITNLEVFVT
jgi:hypothetical protein